MRPLLAREAFRDKKWFLVVNAGPRPLHLTPAAGEEVKIHRAPPGRFWADPFPVVVDGQIWVFFEDYRSSSKKAVISCAPVSADGALGDVSTALERSYHLSYPFILEHEGELYMTPETWAQKRVELWRCRKFPDDWVLERILIDGPAISDPTIHRQDGKLWLFGAVGEAREWANDELHVYMADALDGAWRPHPANPVVSDCRHARPAGRLFSRGGELIRPGQDCSGSYGRGITLNRVEKLTPDCYAEKTVGLIEGAGLLGSSGSHTLNYAGGLEFLDGVGGGGGGGGGGTYSRRAVRSIPSACKLRYASSPYSARAPKAAGRYAGIARLAQKMYDDTYCRVNCGSCATPCSIRTG